MGPQILKIDGIMHVQPIPQSSMFCSNSPIKQQAWARPRYSDSGLDLGLYLFHHEDPLRENGAWKLIDMDLTDQKEKTYAHVQSGGKPVSGCWIYYVVSTRGAGPYDFWLTSETRR